MDYEKIRIVLRAMGTNSALVSKMTNIELEIANSIEDFEEFEHYMNDLARKYNI